MIDALSYEKWVVLNLETAKWRRPFHIHRMSNQQKQQLIVNRKEKKKKKKSQNGRLPFMRQFIMFVGGDWTNGWIFMKLCRNIYDFHHR